MPIRVRGARQVTENFNRLTSRIEGQLTEATLTKILITGMSNAKAIAPIDYGNLVNSEFWRIVPTANGMVMEAGFHAEYALDVHNSRGFAVGKNMPRDMEDPGRGVFWAPNGEPGFLYKGFMRDGKDMIQQIIIDGYKLR